MSEIILQIILTIQEIKIVMHGTYVDKLPITWKLVVTKLTKKYIYCRNKFQHRDFKCFKILLNKFNIPTRCEVSMSDIYYNFKQLNWHLFLSIHPRNNPIYIHFSNYRIESGKISSSKMFSSPTSVLRAFLHFLKNAYKYRVIQKFQKFWNANN